MKNVVLSAENLTRLILLLLHEERGQLFSTYAKYSNKIFRTCTYQGIRNVNFPENLCK